MAFTVVRSAQSSGASANATLAITSPTAGNILVTFFSQTNTTAPTAAGYTVNTTKGVYNASAAGLYVGYKIATGSETAVTWTPGAGATGEGVCYWEIAGGPASITLDGSPVHTDNTIAATISLSVTTAVAGSIILFGVGASSSSGTISAWTGTNVATNISTAAARCFGGSFITGGTVSSAFTANWATSRTTAMLAIAIQPSGGSNKAVTPTTITGVSTMSGTVIAKKTLTPAAITGASAMSSSVVALRRAAPATITSTSTMAALVAARRQVAPAIITATSTMAATVRSLDPVVPASVLGTSTLAVALVFKRALGAAVITGTSVLGGTISGGGGGTGHRHLAPSIALTVAPSEAPRVGGRFPS